jgi:branched-chain amino acid transport system ATP-binding protein
MKSLRATLLEREPNMKEFQVDRLSVEFGGLKAVNDVTFSTSLDEISSIIGPNGAGKTTIFNCITGILKHGEGKITFCGEDISGLKPHSVAGKGIVRTFQKTEVFRELPALECVKIGVHRNIHTGFLDILTNSSRKKKEEKEAVEKAEEILEFVGLQDKKNTVAKNLAYGEQRLLEIAIALAAKPLLLLLDEPASGMNPNETEKVMGLIRSMKERNIGILLIEHDMNLVMGISERVIVLNQGEIICEGDPRFVCTDKEVIKAYLGEGFLSA